MLDRKKSSEYFEQAKELFPGGVNSPVRAFKSVEGPPIFVRKAKGAKLYDEDGNVFLDFCGSWGPMILGHADDNVIEYLQDCIASGTSFGTPSVIGNKLGSLILSNHKYIEKMRFVSSGTEAVMSAIRLARGFTGRDLLVKFDGCYHGHVDSLLVNAGSGLATFGISSSAGIPESFAKSTLVLPLDNEEVLDECFREHGDKIAALIMEPIPANNGLLIQRQEFLDFVRKKCSEYGILLIFDEVISGFRVGFEGAAGFYDIQADIYTYGKIIGGGMPVGAFAGRDEIMSHVAPEGNVYQAGTLSANPITMAAGYMTLQKLLRSNFYDELASKTNKLVSQLESHIAENSYEMGIQSVGSIFWLKFSKDVIRKASQIDAQKMDYFRKIHAYLLEQSIYLGPSGYEVGFISSAHTMDDIDFAAQRMMNAIDYAFNH